MKFLNDFIPKWNIPERDKCLFLSAMSVGESIQVTFKASFNSLKMKPRS